MSDSGPKRILVAVAVWLVLLALCGGAFKFIVAPYWSSSRATAQAQAEYETLSEQARQAGFAPQPLPADADVETIQRMSAELRSSLTGSVPVRPEVKRRVRLAIDSFSGYAVFRSAELADLLAAEEIGLDLVDDRADYGRRMETLASGNTPLALFTIDALLKASAQWGEAPGTIVMIVDETTGADAMVAYKSAVPNIDALNRTDARLVVTRDSPSETLARVVLARFNLPNLPADPFIEASGAQDVFEKFRQASTGDPRAFVLWEPYVSQALALPDAGIVIDSSNFSGYIVDVLCVQRDFLVQNQKLVEAVVRGYLRAAYNLRQQPGGLWQLVQRDAQEQLGETLSEEQARRLADGIWWKNTQENYAHFGLVTGSAAGGLQRLDAMIGNISTVLVKTGAVESDPVAGQPHTLYYDRIFRTMQQENWRPGAGSGDDQTTHAARALRELTAEQWEALVPVAEAAVEPLSFRRGTAELSAQSQEELLRLSETLATLPQYYLLIRGQALAVGDPEANQRLAQGRAQAAADFLIAQGVSAARVRAVSLPPETSGGAAQAVSFVLGQTPY